MRRTGALILASTLWVTACAGSTRDTADDVVETDTTTAGAELPGNDEAPAGDAAAGQDPSRASGTAPGGSAPAVDDAPAGDSASPDGAEAATIPARFHGEWNADLDACGTGASETRLRVGADRLQFYESVGMVTGIDVEGDRAITVTASYQGEGDTWQEERRLMLSEDGSSLTVSSQGAELVRHRCP